jgi:ubiquinone biosynthesis protein COQ9
MSAGDRIAEQKDALLEAMLPDIVFDGWSTACLRKAGESLALDRGAVQAIFPGGPREAARWLDDWADRKMLAALSAMDLPTLKIRERVAAGIMARLKALGPYQDAVRRAIALEASPVGALQAAQSVYRTVDAIWYAAGDTSADFNFYTKRSLLAAAYAPTMLYWLNDRSEGAADTAAFLDRRLADVLQLPRLGQKLRKTVEQALAPFRAFRGGAAR